eukprot:TRINITY_DN286_c0_g1_i1.p1 TRINITY_DN286_c0_g1~~TRINITY_DN286_c0_g1_i1.p1  ORF type:complete len:473 (+),score=90.45 TRINITY_DN286_c0_g1_i1:257-1675(+)
MDSDEGKIFIGGISWETGEEKIKEYFSNFGEVLSVVIMRDRITGRARGFGFVLFADPSVVDRVILEKHSIDGRTVEAKRAVSVTEQRNAKMNNYGNNNQAFGGGNLKTKKIFVGGLPLNLTEEEFRNYFQQFGNVTDVAVMYDQNTQRPRGFGFITFDSEEAVENVLQKTFHQLNEKVVEVKRALPKEVSSGMNNRNAGGYQGYKNPASSMGGYENRADNNRYGQGPAGSGGFPSYGPTTYGGAPGYGSSGYGAPANTGGYGYGNYGMNAYPPPGAAGYPTNANGYGSTPVPNTGFVSGSAGPPKNQWGSSMNPGYGAQNNASAYGSNAGYGSSAPWPASAPTGQSPGGANGYGSTNYGYGYPSSEASYNNTTGYAGPPGPARGGPPSNYNVGTSANDPSTMGGAYGGGYGESHVNIGYSDTAWKSGGSDPSLGGFSGSSSGNYGAPQPDGMVNGAVSYGGYGGSGRQGQRQ